MEIIYFGVMMSLPYLVSFVLAFFIGLKVFGKTNQYFFRNHTLYSIVLFLGLEFVIRKILLVIVGLYLYQTGSVEGYSTLSFILGSFVGPYLNLISLALLIAFIVSCRRKKVINITPVTTSKILLTRLLLVLFLVVVLFFSYGKNFWLLQYKLQTLSSTSQVETIVARAKNTKNPRECIALVNSNFEYNTSGIKPFYQIKNDCVTDSLSPELFDAYISECKEPYTHTNQTLDTTKTDSEKINITVVDDNQYHSCLSKLAQKYNEPALCVMIVASVPAWRECKNLFPDVYKNKM